MNSPTNIAELKKNAKLPAKQAGGKVLAGFFEANRGALEAVLPKHVDAHRMLKIALGAVRQVPQLLECTTESLFGAVVQCAQIGLEPNTVLGHAYLIPFRNHKKDRTDVQVIIGYKGLIDLARRSGQIISIAAHAVRENDEFEFVYGLEEKLNHIPAMDNRGQIIAFYAVAHMQGGGHAFEVMSREQVDAIMRATQSRGKYGPWQDHYEEMGRKTVVRRLAKWLPLSIEFATANALDSVAEAGKDQGLGAVLDGDYSVEDPSGDLEDIEDSGGASGTNERQWPEQHPDGYWVDSTGEPWNAELHSGDGIEEPPVNKDGSFRKRRGAGQQAPDEQAAPATTPQDSGLSLE